MADYTITAGDTAPGIQYEVPADVAGSVPNPANIASVEFQLLTSTFREHVAGPAFVATAGSGNPLLQYSWQDGDTRPAGSYLAKFEVTYTDGTTLSYPRRAPIQVQFMPWPG